MIRMFAKRIANHRMTAGTDKVILGFPIPSGSRIHDIRVRMTLGGDNFLATQQVATYAAEMWLLPVQDPDNSIDMDTVWDNLVPKDTDVETLDLDTGALDTTPFFEPGEPDFSDMLEVGLRPERLFHRHRFLTLPSGAIQFRQDNQTPFNDQWLPGDAFTIRVKRRLAVNAPMILAVAVAAPALDDTTTNIPVTLPEPEWGQLKYIGHVLERALLHLLGVVEAGAETPWEEATALLKSFLEPDVYESHAGDFVTTGWRVFGDAMLDLSVAGELGRTAISSGR